MKPATSLSGDKSGLQPDLCSGQGFRGRDVREIFLLPLVCQKLGCCHQLDDFDQTHHLIRNPISPKGFEPSAITTGEWLGDPPAFYKYNFLPIRDQVICKGAVYLISLRDCCFEKREINLEYLS